MARCSSAAGLLAAALRGRRRWPRRDRRRASRWWSTPVGGGAYRLWTWVKIGLLYVVSFCDGRVFGLTVTAAARDAVPGSRSCSICALTFTCSCRRLLSGPWRGPAAAGRATGQSAARSPVRWSRLRYAVPLSSCPSSWISRARHAGASCRPVTHVAPVRVGEAAWSPLRRFRRRGRRCARRVSRRESPGGLPRSGAFGGGWRMFVAGAGAGVRWVPAPRGRADSGLRVPTSAQLQSLRRAGAGCSSLTHHLLLLPNQSMLDPASPSMGGCDTRSPSVGGEPSVDVGVAAIACPTPPSPADWLSASIDRSGRVSAAPARARGRRRGSWRSARRPSASGGSRARRAGRERRRRGRALAARRLGRGVRRTGREPRRSGEHRLGPHGRCRASGVERAGRWRARRDSRGIARRLAAAWRGRPVGRRRCRAPDPEASSG